MTKSALVLLAGGSEELEAVTIIDVLRRGGLKVSAVSVTTSVTIHCANGTRLLADALLANLPQADTFDVLVLPGGSKAAETYSYDEKVQALIKSFEAAGKLVAVICASTLAIHAAGAFKGRKLTSYPSLRDQVDDLYDYQELSVVTDGNLITSRGPATAMPFALAILQHVCGAEKRSQVASALLFTE